MFKIGWFEERKMDYLPKIDTFSDAYCFLSDVVIQEVNIINRNYPYVVSELAVF